VLLALYFTSLAAHAAGDTQNPDFGPLPKAENGLPDYYKVFGIEPRESFTVAKLKKAYRKLSLLYHPDRHRNNPENQEKAKQRFIEITNGYTLLMDDTKRTQYNMALTSASKQDLGSEDDPAAAMANWFDEMFFQEAQASADSIMQDALSRAEDVFKQFFETTADFDPFSEFLVIQDQNDVDDDDMIVFTVSGEGSGNDGLHQELHQGTQGSGMHDDGVQQFLTSFFAEEIGELKDYISSLFTESSNKNSWSQGHRDEL